MQSVIVRVQERKDEKPAYEGLTPEKITDESGEPLKVAILEAGTVAGNPAVCFLVPTEDGKYTFFQLTAANLLTLAAAVRGACHRWGIDA